MQYIVPYYTNREQEALFVEDKSNGATGSINATSLGLISPVGINSISWGQRNLVNGTTKNLSWQGGIGFFGANPVSRPSGSNLANSITSLGLADYTVTTGSNLVNSIFNATAISYTATTIPTNNIANAICASGLVATYSKPSGSDMNSLLQSASLASVSYSVPTGTNIYQLANATSLVSVAVVTGNKIADSIFNVSGISAPSVISQGFPFQSATQSLHGSLFALGFASAVSQLIQTFPGGSIYSVVTYNTINVISLIQTPIGISSSVAATLGIFPGSDITRHNQVTLNFGLVPSFGSVTRAVSFGGAISSTAISWWYPQSFDVTSSTPGIIYDNSINKALPDYVYTQPLNSPVTAIPSSQITFSTDVGAFPFLGLPANVPTGLVFKFRDITTTGAVLVCYNGTTADITQATASYRILAV